MAIKEVKKQTAEEIAKKALAKFTKYLKAGGACFGETSIESYDDGQYIQVEHNMGSAVNDLVRFVFEAAKDTDIKLVDFKSHEGIYDWAADVYIKPCDCVTFKVK